MQDIKKYPFCGGDGELVQKDSRYGYFVFVHCSICDAQSKVFSLNSDYALRELDTKECEKAVAAWNMDYKGER